MFQVLLVVQVIHFTRNTIVVPWRDMEKHSSAPLGRFVSWETIEADACLHALRNANLNEKIDLSYLTPETIKLFCHSTGQQTINSKLIQALTTKFHSSPLHSTNCCPYTPLPLLQHYRWHVQPSIIHKMSRWCGSKIGIITTSMNKLQCLQIFLFISFKNFI